MTTKFSFLNVGDGDSTVITTPSGLFITIDINISEGYSSETLDELKSYYEQISGAIFTGEFNNSFLQSEEAKTVQSQLEIDTSIANPVEFIKSEAETAPISNIMHIQTHPDSDHYKGFDSLANSEHINIGELIDTAHTIDKSPEDESLKKDWEAYIKIRNNPSICTKVVRYKQLKRGGITWHIFNPTAEMINEASENDTPNVCSIVVLAEVAGKKILFGGDSETAQWNDLWEFINDSDNFLELFKNIDILKAPHHGRKSGKVDEDYSRDFINHLDPDIVIISVGKKSDSDSSEWYRQRRDEDAEPRSILSTVFHGNIYIHVDDSKGIYWESEKSIKQPKHEDNPEDKWKMQLNTHMEFDLEVGIFRTKSNTRPEFEYSSGIVIPNNYWIRFMVPDFIQPQYKLYWRTTNNGYDAWDANDLRGEIFEDKNNKRTHWEKALYKGIHSVTCFLIETSTDKCIATTSVSPINIARPT